MFNQNIFRTKKFGWVKFFLIFIILYFFLNLWQQRDLPTGKAPPISGIGVNGNYLSSEELTDSPTLVYFWATWCKICSFTFQNIKNISNDYQVLSIAIDSGSKAEIKEYIKGREIPVILDTSGKIKKDWNVKGVPSFFIIGKEGDIKFAKVGYISELHIRAYLALYQ